MPTLNGEEYPVQVALKWIEGRMLGQRIESILLFLDFSERCRADVILQSQHELGHMATRGYYNYVQKVHLAK
jgi:hypothetical protein